MVADAVVATTVAAVADAIAGKRDALPKNKKAGTDEVSAFFIYLAFASLPARHLSGEAGVSLILNPGGFMLAQVIALTLLTASSALAAPAVPDCWTTNGAAIGLNSKGVEIEDGTYNIVINTKAAAKDDLLSAMKAAINDYLRTEQYPVILSDTLILTTKGIAYSALPRPAFQREVEKEIAALAAVPGVEVIDCNVVNRIPEDGDKDGGR